jgi:hypothetical protein
VATKKSRKRGRKRGSGVLKTIDAAKQDAFDIRRRLHFGGEPTRDSIAQLLMRWRNLCAERDDCEKRLKAGQGDRWTRSRLRGGTWLNGTRKFKGLYQEIDEAWRELGAALGALSDAELMNPRA